MKFETIRKIEAIKIVRAKLNMSLREVFYTINELDNCEWAKDYMVTPSAKDKARLMRKVRDYLKQN